MADLEFLDCEALGVMLSDNEDEDDNHSHDGLTSDSGGSGAKAKTVKHHAKPPRKHAHKSARGGIRLSPKSKARAVAPCRRVVPAPSLRDAPPPYVRRPQNRVRKKSQSLVKMCSSI